jgi:hypothetical protein
MAGYIPRALITSLKLYRQHEGSDPDLLFSGRRAPFQDAINHQNLTDDPLIYLYLDRYQLFLGIVAI